MNVKLLSIAVVAAFSLSSCFEEESVINVKADGSGTVVQEIIFSAEVSAIFSQMAQAGPGGIFGGGGNQAAGAAPTDPIEKMFSEEEAKKQAASMGEGVSLAKVEKIDQDGARGARVTFAFKDINKLQLNMGGPDSPAGGPEQAPKPESKPYRFKFADGKLTVLCPRPDATKQGADETPELDEATRKQSLEMAKQTMKDSKMALRIEIEPGIRKSDATHVDGKRVTLMELDFKKLLDDPNGLPAFEKLQNSPDNAAALLKGVSGVRVETKETVVIEFN